MKIKLLALGAMFASLYASVQGQTPIDKTPLLHLSFDNVSGTTVINDGSGGAAMNGTLNGTASIVSGGKFGSCLSITGANASDASCRIANSVVPLNGSSTWTVAMWVQTTTPGGCYAYQGSGGWESGNTSFYLNQGNGNPGTLAGGVRWGQNWVSGTSDITSGGIPTWHHIVVSCDGSTRSVYVDGVLENSGDTDWGASGTGNQFWVGGNASNNDGAANLNGLVDEVYVFNRTLSQADITQLYNNNTVPKVPVSVTVNPTSGYRGQVFTVTATATPAVGTVTNAKVNLSAIGLSSTATLVQSSVNVFTNTFTAPTNAPVGAALLTATVISTEPLVGSSGATFTVVAKPPTNAIVLTQLTNTTAYQYTKTTFRFATTNDAPNDAPFPMTYSWYKNGSLVSTNPMGPNYTFLTVPADNGAQIYAIARVADTNFSSISVTSAVVTLTVNSGTPEYPGLKQEVFAGASRADVEIGNTGLGITSFSTNADSPGGFGDNTSRRYSGYFTPPTSDAYVFFLASDDDCDLFLSTDANPANKQLIAQETTWSGTRAWLSGASILSQKRSDQWTNSVGFAPYAAGINLVGGQKYYIESVMHNGGGGDNWAMTYQTTTEVASGLPVDTTSQTQFAVASNNITFATWPGTAINWATQPRPSVTVNEGQSTNLTAIAISDAELTPKYQWFVVTSGGSLPGTALTGKIVNGTNLTMALIPAGYNNAQVYCIASTEFGGLSVTSSVATLHVIQSVFEPGWVSEKKWMDVFNINGAENGTLGDPTLTGIRAGFQAGLDNPGSLNRDNTIQQIGYFVAPSSGNYVFFITSHDGGDLFLSTDNTAVNKRLIAQEAGWSGNFAWNQAGGGGSIIPQKRSDQYTNSTSGGTAPYAAGIPLVAGQRYYMEVDHTTSRWGNEQFGVAYRVMSGGGVTAPADGELPNVNGSVVGMNAIRCSYVNFTQQPSNVTAAPMGYATFAVSGVTDSQYPPISSYGVATVQSTNSLFYQWYKNGVAIPGATARTLTLGPLLPSDSGATVYCAMRALGFANDSLTPIWTNSTSATLTVSPQPVLENGVARVDWWSNTTSRVSVENGGAGAPTFSFVAPKFESPTANAPWNDYVNRISGYFVAPSNGVYIFFISGDDDSDLFISTDANPANKKLVAQQTSWSNPFQWTTGNDAAQRRSDTYSPDAGVTFPGNPGYVGGLPMVGGQKYWIEGVHHNGGGGNNFEVTYREYNEYAPDPIVDGADSRLGGNLIASYVPRIPWVAFLQQPVSQSATSGGNPVTFTALGTNPPSVWIGTTGNPALWLTNPPTSSVRYQWYKNNTAIPGATSSSYTLPYVLPSDQGAQFVCQMRALGYSDDAFNPIWSNSTPAVLTVTTDTAPPTLVSAITLQNTNQVPPLFIVDVTFSEWMDATTLNNPASYVGISGITNISVAANHRTVQLLLNSMPTLPLNITVSGVKDLSGNTIAINSTVAVTAEKLNFSDVGTPGADPAYPSYVWSTGNGGYIVSAEGSDIWNAVDGFNFGWELKTNDFDMVVRGVSITPTSQWAKQGLMVREDLSPGSREWSIQNEPLAADGGANRIDTSMRSTNGLASVGWSIAGTLPPPSYPNAWLRMKRTGSFLDGYYSTNGVDWVHATSYNTATNDVPLGSVVYFGICTTAHNNDSVNPVPTTFLYYNTAEYANYGPYVPAPNRAVVSVSRSGSNLNVSWTPAGGHLEASPALSGPSVNWQTVTSSNPATVPIGNGTQFFRVVNP